MSSYDNRYGTSEGSQFGSSSRHSNTLARLVNFYGNSGSTTTSSISPSRVPTPYTPSRQSPPVFTPYNESTSNYEDINQTRFKTTQELTSLSRINNDSSDSVVIAGKNLLQILKIENSTITPVNDLLSSSYYLKNKKVIGSILDVEAGYHNHSKFIATSTTTGSIFIFNNTSQSKNKLVLKYSDHTRAVNSISFSQLDSHSLLSGSQDGAMKLWDLRSNLTKPVFTMIGNSDAVRSLKFSPFHNKKMCAIFDSGVIQKWDLRVPTQFERKFNAHTGPGLSIDWHPELDYIVSGGRDKQVQVWNMNNNDARQLPEHVIYTAAPVNNVCFRPNSNGVSNIMNAEVATSFLTNDLSVQIYSLKRKYIPEYTIESHHAQISGLVFKDERTLLTCSKDKSLVRDDLNAYYHPIDNLPINATSWSVNDDLVFINQEREPKELEPILESNNQYSGFNPISSMMSTSPNNSPGNSAGTTAVNTPSVSSFPDLSPRPGISRSSSTALRPSVNRALSHGSHHNNVSNYSNPFVVPISLPISKSNASLKYLSDNYMFDPSHDLIMSCEINASVANDVDCLRDSQTWKVIKESLIWETQLENELKYELDGTTEVEINTTAGHDYETDNEKDYHYSTSNSTTNYGKSPALSDLSEFNSLNSKEMSLRSKEDLKITKARKSFDEIQEKGEEVSDDQEEVDKNKTVTKEDILKWDDLPVKQVTEKDDTVTKEEDDEEEQQGEEEEAIEFVESKATSKPISLPGKRKPRSSILEAILPPNSDESNKIGKSSSPSYSITSSFSNASNSLRTLTQSLAPLLHKSNFNKLTKQDSHKSELTRQLTNQKQEKEADNKLILPPYAPKFLIKKAIDFSLQQGDLIMSCTLLLLFNDRYKLYGDKIVKDMIHSYLEFLKKLQFFITFTKIISISKYNEFKEMSLNSTILRRFCSKCGVLIVNENLKEAVLKDPKIEFGTWFCENCHDKNLCTYCNEPIKGLTIFRLKCGHSGHFGCFKTWIIDEQMDVCPAGCLF